MQYPDKLNWDVVDLWKSTLSDLLVILEEVIVRRET